MCRPPGILAKAQLRTARRSVPATFVGCGTAERACYFGRLCLRYPLDGFRVPFKDLFETVGYF